MRRETGIGVVTSLIDSVDAALRKLTNGYSTMRESNRRCAAETKRRTRAGLSGFDFAVTRWRCGHERVE